MDCINTAKYLITYNNEDPGTQNTVNALFQLVCLPSPREAPTFGRCAHAWQATWPVKCIRMRK